MKSTRLMSSQRGHRTRLLIAALLALVACTMSTPSRASILRC